MRLADLPIMPDKDLVGLVYTTRVAEAHDLVRSLVRLLQIEDRSWTAPADLIELTAAELDRTSTIITAGGDGTILRTLCLESALHFDRTGQRTVDDRARFDAHLKTTFAAAQAA